MPREYVILHEDGLTISDVVEFVSPDHPGAVAITPECAHKFRRVFQIEAEYVETLRTGLSTKARGVKFL